MTAEWSISYTHDNTEILPGHMCMITIDAHPLFPMPKQGASCYDLEFIQGSVWVKKGDILIILNRFDVASTFKDHITILELFFGRWLLTGHNYIALTCENLVMISDDAVKFFTRPIA